MISDTQVQHLIEEIEAASEQEKDENHPRRLDSEFRAGKRSAYSECVHYIRMAGRGTMMETQQFHKPEVELVGQDGNVFAIIGAVTKALKRDGQGERAKEFSGRAVSSGSYDKVLQLVSEYVEPC